MDGEKKTLINDVKSMLELNFIATFNLYAFVISLTFFRSFTLFFNNLNVTVRKKPRFLSLQLRMFLFLLLLLEF